VLRDTWTLQGDQWTLAATTGPSGRYNTPLAYDEARARVVMFSGTGFDFTSSRDTWEWDGVAWAIRSGAGPFSGGGHAMAYDAARQRTILVQGGFTGSATWEWDGATWTLLTVPGPSSRSNAAMAYDPHRGSMVLFGGQLSSGAALADTWEYDGTEWTQRLVQGPSPRSGHTMTWDPQRRRVVLIGGWVYPVAFADVWEWDGQVWTQRAGAGPSPRHGHAAAYDPAAGGIVIFGGNDGVSRSDRWFLPSATEPPAILDHPAHLVVRHGSTAVLAVTAAGVGPLAYQWRRNGQPVSDGPGGASPSGGTVTGANQPTLTIASFQASDQGSFDCVVSNSCGGDTSAPARVALACNADFNADGFNDDADIRAFFACLAGQCCAQCPPYADFDGDGDTGADSDIEAFFRVLAGGSC
jgi:hypothetical protein